MYETGRKMCRWYAIYCRFARIFGKLSGQASKYVCCVFRLPKTRRQTRSGPNSNNIDRIRKSGAILPRCQKKNAATKTQFISEKWHTHTVHHLINTHESEATHWLATWNISKQTGNCAAAVTKHLLTPAATKHAKKPREKYVCIFGAYFSDVYRDREGVHKRLNTRTSFM